MSAVLYQTMPPLSTDEYADLEASILANGIQVPIIVDECGVVIDGHHRKAIAEHHGLHLPSETRQMLTEAQKYALSIELNIARRQLNREQKRAIVAELIKSNPEKSNREHARTAGVDHKTAGAIRDELESTGEIPQFDTRIGADGKERPASRPAPVNVDGVLADPVTGEVVDGPATSETTRTETYKTTEKFGHSTPPEPKPVPTGAEANRLNAIQSAKSIGRSLEALQHLNYERARVGIVTEWWPLGRHEVPPEQAAYFTPAELRKLAQGFNATADLLEAHHGN